MTALASTVVLQLPLRSVSRLYIIDEQKSTITSDTGFLRSKRFRSDKFHVYICNFTVALKLVIQELSDGDEKQLFSLEVFIS